MVKGNDCQFCNGETQPHECYRRGLNSECSYVEFVRVHAEGGKVLPSAKWDKEKKRWTEVVYFIRR